MITVTGLRKSIRNGSRTVDILKGLDFHIPRGQFAAIMGSSGSGKSTLLGLLAGLDTPSAGDVALNGPAISYLPTGNLDSANGTHVLELLLELNKTEGTTLVLVTHDAVLAGYANRRITLRDGLIVSDEMNAAPAELAAGAQT